MMSGFSDPMNIDDEEEETTHQFQSFFAEADQVNALVSDYATITEISQLKKHTQKLQRIFEKYLEKGQLLDPHLEGIISLVMDLVEQVLGMKQVTKIGRHVQMNSVESLRRSLFTVLYLLIKVRGYKAIVKQFPHDLSQLESLYSIYATIPVFEWETRYVIMLWLSLIVMNPFPFSAVDVNPESETSLTRRMMNAATQALSDSGKTRDGASVFLSKLLTRHDLHGQLITFLNWASDSLAHSDDQVLRSGIFATLIDIFKNGRRDEMILVVATILPFAVADTSDVGNGLIRQLTVKLAQRIGLIYLRPRVVSWRYQKGRKSLLQNLRSTNTSLSKNQNSMESDVSEEDHEDVDVPEQIEEVIGKMLEGLRDRETIVRWSAAKGVGRITMRLPKHFGDEVVGSVLDLLSPGEGDNAWHGGCLALAELARRGLLLPERLDTVVPVLQKALEYDERKGAHSVGSHVRDSACYVCWAFSRAYAPDVMSPYVSSLARGLLKTAVFDREVNCRRAAAAAFQENVGRQGNFPHGIDILTKADYFTLSNRSNAYLEVSYFIAQYPEYCQSLVDHLVEVKSVHWDKSVRELSAQALHRLCELDVPYMASTVLPSLLLRCFVDDINIRHGSIIAAADVMYGLAKQGHIFSSQLKTDLKEVIPTIEAKRLYRGKGGEIIREAVCYFIERIALSRLDLPEISNYHAAVGPRVLKKRTLNVFQETLDTNLKHPNEEIIDIAIRAFKAFTSQYYVRENIELGRSVISQYIDTLKTDINPATRRGYSLALGSIPKQLIDENTFKDVSSTLIQKISIESNPELHDAESRRNAVLGLITLCETSGVGDSGVNVSNLGSIFASFLIGANDYSVDKRGDIGSLVREASIQALHRWAKLLCANDARNDLFSVEMASSVISCILKQAVEKIDRVRDHAGNILKNLLLSENPVIINIPQKETLRQLISEDEQETDLIDWSSPEVTFPIFVKCLNFDEYRSSLLSGLVISVGGLSSHVFKHSAEALVKFIKELNRGGNKNVTAKISEDLLRILQTNQLDDRVVVPLLKSLGHLFSHDCLDFLTPDQYSLTEQIIVSITAEMKQTKNISKIFICIDVLCELLRFEDPTRMKSIQRLFTSGLMSRYPKVREYAGQQIYGTLQIADFLDEEVTDDVFDILSSTNWTNKLDDIITKVDELYNLLGVQKIVLVKKSMNVNLATKPQAASQQDSYANLVRDFGY